MNINFIKTFICVALSGSLSKASDKLYTSQSTVSYRLNELEIMLGVTLIKRSRGGGSIELTNEGRQFLPIALEFIELHTRVKNFRTEVEYFSLNIAGVESLNIYLLGPFYKALQHDSYDWRLYIQNLHSQEIFNLVNSQSIDIGFVVSQLAEQNVISEEFYQEEIVVASRNPKLFRNKTIDMSELNDVLEVYVDWGGDYNLWRSRFLREAHVHKWRSDSFSTAYPLLQDDLWAFIPYSICHQLPDLYYFRIKDNAPFRRIYMIYNSKSYGVNSEIINLFRQKIKNYLPNTLI